MRPSEPEWPPETSPVSESADYHLWRSDWDARVDSALAAKRTDALGDLYAELTRTMPSQQASEIWMQKMSGWDASAVTG